MENLIVLLSSVSLWAVRQGTSIKKKRRVPNVSAARMPIPAAETAQAAADAGISKKGGRVWIRSSFSWQCWRH